MLKGEAREVTTAVEIVAVGAVEGTETVVVYSLYATTTLELDDSYAVCLMVTVSDFAVGINAPHVAVVKFAFTLVAVDLVANVCVVDEY